MNAALLSLLAYVAWTLSLISVLVVQRTFLTLTGKHAANAFSVSGDDVSPFSARLTRAHANCLENLPLFAIVILVAVVSARVELVEALAPVVVVLRVLQSSVHLVSTSVPAVRMRFAFFAPQLFIVGFLLVRVAVDLAGV